jgi:hypothetical protein
MLLVQFEKGCPMSGQPGRSGGSREHTGGAREGAGRPDDSIEVMPRDASLIARKWRYAEKALAYADEMIERLADLARNAEAEAVKLGAMKELLDRALGKSPQHVDITALRPTEIVYRSAAEIRQALMAEGVPKALLDLQVEDESE